MPPRIADKTAAFLFFLCAAAFIFLFSCSLDYGGSASAVLFPELTLHNAEFYRFEDGKISARLNASRLETYRSDSTLFGSDVAFQSFDDSGKTSAEGQAALFFADQKKDLYSLLGGTRIVSRMHDVRVEAGNIRWNNKTEQLTAAKNETVTITRGGFAGTDEEPAQTFTVTGSGFSADGGRQNFTFAGKISGVIEEDQLLQAEDAQ